MDILLGMHPHFDLYLYSPRLPLRPTIPNLTLSMLAWTKPLHLDQNYVPGGPLNRDHHQAQFSHGENLGKE